MTDVTVLTSETDPADDRAADKLGGVRTEGLKSAAA